MHLVTYKPTLFYLFGYLQGPFSFSHLISFRTQNQQQEKGFVLFSEIIPCSCLRIWNGSAILNLILLGLCQALHYFMPVAQGWFVL